MSTFDFLRRNRFQFSGRGKWSPGLFVALFFLAQCTLTPFHVHHYINHQANHHINHHESGTCSSPIMPDSGSLYEKCEHPVCQCTLSCCNALLGQYLNSIQVLVPTENSSLEAFKTEEFREDLVEGDPATVIKPATQPYTYPSLLALKLRAPPQA